MCVECDNPKPHAPHVVENGYEYAELTIDQGRTLAVIESAWDRVTVYDSGPNKLVIASKRSEYALWLMAPDGSRQRISDPLNQQHWLQDVLSGRWKVVRV